jgi:diacylglycerol kinase (ATP)
LFRLTECRVVLQHAESVIGNRIVSFKGPALIFVNPSAGGGKAIRLLPEIRRVFEQAGIPAEFVETSTASEMAARAKFAVAENRKLLVAMGGDGTLHELVNAVPGADVILGVIPVGGGNDFAAALNLPKDPLEAARAMLNGEPRWVDVVKTRTADGSERLYLGGGGAGLDAEAAQYAGTTFRQARGRRRYAASALAALWRFQPLKATVSFPESELQQVESNVLLAAVMNTPTYGAGLRLAPAAAPDDGWLDVVLVEELGWFEIIRVLPILLWRGELRTKRIKRMVAKNVRISTDRSCIFHGDGEVLGVAPVDISVVPRAVQILAPRRG